MKIMTSYAATLLENTVYTSNIYFCRINDIIIGILGITRAIRHGVTKNILIFEINISSN